MLACGGCHQSIPLPPEPLPLGGRAAAGCGPASLPVCKILGVGLGLTAEAPVGWVAGSTHSRLQLSDLPSLSRTRGLPGVRLMRMDTQGLCASASVGVTSAVGGGGAGGEWHRRVEGGSDADRPPLPPQRRAGPAAQAPSPMKRAEASSPLGAPPTVEPCPQRGGGLWGLGVLFLSI